MYNVKILEYANESAQIIVYSNPVDCPKKEDEKENELFLEPFHGTSVREVLNFTQTNAEENLRKSISRTKKKINMYARGATFEWFTTHTFDPTLVDRSNFKECSKKMRNWLHNVKKRFAPDLKYIAVPELHSDGFTFHFHCLLADIGSLNIKDSKKKTNGTHGQTIYNIPQWKWGYSTATKIIDTHRVQSYITKYITKDCYLLASGAHRYYASNNLPLPKASTMLIEPQEQEATIQQIAESLGLDIVYRSKQYSNPFTDATYFELQ